MFKALMSDAIELARVRDGQADRKSILRTVLATDAYRALLLNRVRETASSLHIPIVPHAMRVLQTALLGIEISPDAHLGVGVDFSHPVGIVIGGNARIGDRVRFYGNNTIGSVNGSGYPTIGNDVEIGAGARVLGEVTIGDRASIGANAVVMCDVPADHVAIGIPAKVRPRRDK